jgi:pimeloyl-ACP methyl ester carboxylesterase
MPFMPFQVLGIWLRGLLALILLGVGLYLLREWYAHRTVYITEPAPAARTESPHSDVDRGPARQGAEAPPPAPQEGQVRRVDWQFGFNRETAYLLVGLALVGWSLGGRFLGPSLWRRRGDDEPKETLRGTVQRLRRPDGAELHVELYGPEGGTPVVLTPGWGLDSDEWYYAKKELGDRFRLIAWDLPGLGRSSRPADNDWDLDKLAGHLGAVLALAGERPAVLVGHSIGGMIILTFCRLFPEALGRQVCGLVLAHSTYTNPVKTTSMAGLYTAIQKPILEPLCHLMVWLSPLVWLMNWLSYLNGSAHRSTERSSFSGQESKGQLDFLTRYYVRAWPGVVARGMLAMFRYDATGTLGSIPVRTLIVTGAQDKTCTPEASAEMSRAIPEAALLTLEPARHCGLFEHHRQFAAGVGNFVAACVESQGQGAPEEAGHRHEGSLPRGG